MRSSISLFILLIANCSTVLAADLVEAGFPGIETVMTQEELRATGIADLSEAQVRTLNEWLINYTAKDAPTMVQGKKVQGKKVQKKIETKTKVQNKKEEKNEQYKPVTSRIVGTFKGWRGTTRVTLENGETWQQRHKVKWIVKMENPEVIIEKNFIGFYKMTFVKQGRSVGVKRIN